MQIDLELYRQDIHISRDPLVRLSVIHVAPERPRRTMVFIHGFGGWATHWSYQLREFSDSNRVIAVDLRGHGNSDKPDGSYKMERIVADLESVLDSLGVNEKIVLVGHSYGGAVAAQFAAEHPNRIDRLVLVATAGEFKLNPIYRLLLKLPYTVLRALTTPTRKWLGAPPHILKSWYQENLSKWVGWSLFRDLTVPTLVIRGHLDIVFEKPMFEEVARAIPGSQEVDVGASGHMVMLERRDAVNRALERFMESEVRTWFDVTRRQEAARASLIEDRPWLLNYDEGVPHTIAVPRVPLHHLLDSAVRRYPRRIALHFEGSSLTYLRLNKEVNRFANALRSLGLEKGDRVVLLLPNLPQQVIAFFGTLKAGGVVVFSLPTTESHELVRMVEQCGARFLITLTQFDELIQHIKTELESQGTSPLEHIIFTHITDYLPLHKRIGFFLSRQQRKRHLLDIPMDASMHIFKEFLYSHSQEAPQTDISFRDPAVIIFTGGTTDSPKGVMLSHRNLVSNAIQTRHWIPDAQEGRERFLCVLPFSHSYGLTTALLVPIALGATLILKPIFDVLDVLKTIKRRRPTIFPGVPRMYVAINDFPGVRKYGIESIKACISGSAALPLEVQEAFEKLTRGRLVEGYGLTEASPVTHGNPLNGRRKVGSIGIPFPSTEARVVDLGKGQEEVPTGQIGELAVRGPQVMMGYWRDPEATQEVLSRDRWLLTGDVAQMDPEGYFRIVARKADMWYPSKPGKPAFPRDVEEVLYEVPQVKEAAVVAIAGQPIAFVIPRKERPSADALIEYSKRRLPPELVPRLVIFVDEFPRTFIGKVLRRELVDRYQQSSLQQDQI